MTLSIKEKQEICEVLNSFEVIEQGEGWLIVDASEENLSALESVGVKRETVLRYGNLEDGFCILSLAFSENYADLYGNDGLVKCDDYISIYGEDNVETVLYRIDDELYLGSFDGEVFNSHNLTVDEIMKIASMVDDVTKFDMVEFE